MQIDSGLGAEVDRALFVGDRADSARADRSFSVEQDRGPDSDTRCADVVVGLDAHLPTDRLPSQNQGEVRIDEAQPPSSPVRHQTGCFADNGCSYEGRWRLPSDRSDLLGPHTFAARPLVFMDCHRPSIRVLVTAEQRDLDGLFEGWQIDRGRLWDRRTTP